MSCFERRTLPIGLNVLLALIAGSFCQPANAQLAPTPSLQTTILQAQPAMVKVFGAKAGKVEGNATGFAVSKTD